MNISLDTQNHTSNATNSSNSKTPHYYYMKRTIGHPEQTNKTIWYKDKTYMIKTSRKL
jgi:hypothetical protein